jgi:hypothetical protein
VRGAPDDRVDGPGATGDIDLWDRELLELVLCRPEWLPQIAEAIRPEDLRSAACRDLYAKCLELAEAGIAPDFDRLMLDLEDPKTGGLLVALDQGCHAKAGSDCQLRLDQTLESFRRRKEDVEHRKKIAALQQQRSEASEGQAFDQLMAELKFRHRRSDPTDG